MKHRRLKHQVDAPLAIIKGWQFFDEELFKKTGLGEYEYDFISNEFKYLGKKIEKFSIIKIISEWYKKDQEKHHIDTSKIEKSVLLMKLRKIDRFEKISLFDKIFKIKLEDIFKRYKYKLETEMIIKTDEIIYSKKSNKWFQ